MSATINLLAYGNNITSRVLSDEIYNLAMKILESEDVIMDFSGIATITTYCAKSIFGRLYSELGPDYFYNRVMIVGANPDVKIIIKEGLLDHIDGHDLT